MENKFNSNTGKTNNCLDMKDKIIRFLENHLIGKNLATDEVVYTLGNGKLGYIQRPNGVFQSGKNSKWL